MTDELVSWKRKLGIVDFHFEDLTIILNKNWTLDFCKEIKKHELKITWQMPNGARAENIDEEMLGNLKASGCTNIPFASESGSVEILAKFDRKLDLE